MLNKVKSRNTGRRIISFMHISLDGFVAAPNGEINWIKVDEEIFDRVDRRISENDIGRKRFSWCRNNLCVKKGK